MNSKFKVDSRTIADVYEEMQGLAKAYTPEWSFQTENPDVGSAIAMIFGAQMQDNMKKTNAVLDRYRIEFVNLLDLSLLPAFPSEGTVVMHMISGTVEGTYVPSGTKLLGAPVDEGDNIIFETMQTMYMTGAHIDYILAISRNQGKIIAYKGKMDKPPLIRGLDEPLLEQGENDSPKKIAVSEGLDELYLFDYRKKGVAENHVMIYHDSAFDIRCGGKILLRFKNLAGESYENLVDDACYQWNYFKNGKFVPFAASFMQGDVLVLSALEEMDHLEMGGKTYQCIGVQCKKPVLDSVSVERIELASEASDVSPEFVCLENTELDVDRFMPFGNTARLFSECYIGENKILGQKGAIITLRFALSFEEKLVTMSPEAEEATLKVIKRKPRKIEFDVAKTSVQKVIFEYFNSKGWVKLSCNYNFETLFDGKTEGSVVISFPCPEDIDHVSAGGFRGRAIRIRVQQADNCYLQPCIHNMPVISDLTLSYTYAEGWRLPVFTDKITGVCQSDLSGCLLGEDRMVIFEPLKHERDALLLGLSKKPEGEPFSLFFVIEDNVNYKKQNVTFEYSSLRGFKKMKVIDLTDGLRKTGLVLVMTPADFAKVWVEGTESYWIRIVDDRGDAHRFDGTYPKINQIHLNGVNVRNIETKPSMDFFIDNTKSNLTFQLPYSNILESEVYVNEKGSLPLHELTSMIENNKQDVRADYDYLGNLKACYVKWQEVDNFDQSKLGDRHYVLDRMTNKLHFGDGVNVRIPQATTAVAFTVTVKCCEGVRANLPAGSIQTAQDRVLYIGAINNPVATFGGSDIEKPESAIERAAGMLSSKNRLVSHLDFEREAKANFSQIQAVKCVSGLNADGIAVDGEVTMVILIKEYDKGSYAFEGIAEKLRAKLLSTNEFVFHQINVVEPIFVKLEAVIWICTEEYEHIFEIQNKFIDELCAFIDPIAGCYGTGWSIGRLPTVHQLRRIMKRTEINATVNRYIFTASYRDHLGWHEVDFIDLNVHPFMIGVNGKHKVIIENFK